MEKLIKKIESLEKNQKAMIPLTVIGFPIPVFALLGGALGIVYSKMLNGLKDHIPEDLDDGERKKVMRRINDLATKRSRYFLPFIPLVFWTVGMIVMIVTILGSSSK